MARRSSVFEDLMALSARLPWGIGLGLAVVSYLGLHWAASYYSVPDSVLTPADIGAVAQRQLVATLAFFLQWIIPLGFGAGALVSFVRRTRGAGLFNRAVAGGTATVTGLTWSEFEHIWRHDSPRGRSWVCRHVRFVHARRLGIRGPVRQRVDRWSSAGSLDLASEDTAAGQSRSTTRGACRAAGHCAKAGVSTVWTRYGLENGGSRILRRSILLGMHAISALPWNVTGLRLFRAGRQGVPRIPRGR
jgi:hypothetical protein